MGRRGRGGGGGMHQITGDRGHDHDGFASRGGRGGGGGGGRGGGGGGGGRSRTNVGYLNPAAPSFIQKLRAQHGLLSREESHEAQLSQKRPSAGDSAAAAAAATPEDLDNRPVMPDEAPQIVVLKKKHLSEDEVKAFMEGGAKGLEGVLEPAAKKARTDGEGGEAGAADAGAPGASASSAGATAGAAEAGAPKAGDKEDKKKKKSKKPAVAKGAMSKKLNKRNTKVLSFEDDDTW